MKIVFVSNFFNHHQKFLSDQLYKLTVGQYWFVATAKMAECQKKLGYPEYQEPYIIEYNTGNRTEVENIILDADVAIISYDFNNLAARRVAAKKLTFGYSERLFKSPKNFLKSPVYAYKAFKRKGSYMLCASAFTAHDYTSLSAYKDKYYKWGYFPEAKHYDDIDSLIKEKPAASGLERQGFSILWVARLIGWKHPESVVEVSNQLKMAGYEFQMNVIGQGPKEGMLRKMISNNNLEDCVHILGAMPPNDVRSHMEKADIFMFTSDRNEGWGAVINESMNSACAVVASHAIGSVPFLIQDGKNGLIYKDQNWDNLYQKIVWLIEHPVDRKAIQKEAYKTITKVWNAENAAKSFLQLVEAIQKGEDTPFLSGPCSKAPILKHNWY